MQSNITQKKRSLPDHAGKVTANQQTKLQAGSAAVHHSFSGFPIQTKLTIGSPNDRYEKEADAMADRIMRMPIAPVSLPSLKTNGNSIQAKCAACEHEEEQIRRKPLMMKSDGGQPVATKALGNELTRSKGGGQPLPVATNRFMSSAFGTDFSHVRIYTGTSAQHMNQGLNAKAFTHGSDIYFNRGQYNPGSSEGKHLLGHELTHVVQQTKTPIRKIQKQSAPALPWKTATVDLLSFDGSTRDPYSDLAHANRIYSPCRVRFVVGTGISVDPAYSGPLMGNDTTFERANRATNSAEESSLIPSVTSTFSLNSRLRVLYFERINPPARGTSHRATGSTPLTVNHVYMTNTAADRTLAHEFGHILLDGNFHHLPSDNLMHPSNTATDSNLTTSQCTTIRSKV